MYEPEPEPEYSEAVQSKTSGRHNSTAQRHAHMGMYGMYGMYGMSGMYMYMYMYIVLPDRLPFYCLLPCQARELACACLFACLLACLFVFFGNLTAMNSAMLHVQGCRLFRLPTHSDATNVT
jgi:hypothetical protein